MTYDWRPTASRATTTAPRLVALDPPASAAPHSAPPADILVITAIEEFIEAAEDGRARNRSGRPYRPSALRDLRGCLRHQVARDLGDLRLRDVRPRHVQRLVDRLAADGLSESRIRSIVSAVRALYGYAIQQGYVELSPADKLVIPREDEPTGQREHEDEAAWRWADDVDETWQERPATRRARDEPRPAERSRTDYQPIALLPERILSLVLRIVVVIFVLFALVTIVQSA